MTIEQLKIKSARESVNNFISYMSTCWDWYECDRLFAYRCSEIWDKWTDAVIKCGSDAACAIFWTELSEADQETLTTQADFVCGRSEK